MDKKILLVHPEVSRNKYNFNGILENEPLELEYLSAVLKQEGYDPEIFDVPREAVSLEEKLRQYRPDVFYICGRIKLFSLCCPHYSRDAMWGTDTIRHE